MTGPASPSRAPVNGPDMVPRILHALAEAVREALLHHKRAGQSVAIWRNGRVEWLSPEDIHLPEPRVDAPGVSRAVEVREPEPDRP